MPTKKTDKPTSTDDLRILPVEEVALRLGMSLRTLERLATSGDGPQITHLSTRCRGIRADHLREWIEAKSAASAA